MSSQSRPRTRSSTVAICCTAAALLACLPSAAEAADGMLRVAATVVRRTSVGIDPPGSLTVSAADVARGWLQVDTPMLVRSNVPEGYALVFQQHGAAIGEVQVLGMGAPVVLVPGGEAIAARPAAGTGYWTERVTLRFRFALQPGTQPGELPWPLQISLLPR